MFRAFHFAGREVKIMRQMTRGEEKPHDRRAQQRSAVKYIFVLFAVVLAMIVLSYFMSQRTNARADTVQDDVVYSSASQRVEERVRQ